MSWDALGRAAAPQHVGSSPSRDKCGEVFQLTGGVSVLLPIHAGILISVHVGIPPPVNAGSRHMTLNMSVRLKAL